MVRLRAPSRIGAHASHVLCLSFSFLVSCLVGFAIAASASDAEVVVVVVVVRVRVRVLVVDAWAEHRSPVDCADVSTRLLMMLLVGLRSARLLLLLLGLGCARLLSLARKSSALLLSLWFPLAC
jgi:hypothetical protein